MTRAEILDQLRALKPWLKEKGVAELALFGSFARNEARSDSDIDLLVRFDRTPGLAFFDLEHELGERLGRPVEMAVPDGLNRFIRARALAEAIVV